MLFAQWVPNRLLRIPRDSIVEVTQGRGRTSASGSGGACSKRSGFEGFDRGSEARWVDRREPEQLLLDSLEEIEQLVRLDLS